jgi:hypothetical protein
MWIKVDYAVIVIVANLDDYFWYDELKLLIVDLTYIVYTLMHVERIGR